MNHQRPLIIKNAIIRMLANTKRPLNSRAIVRAISSRYRFPRAAVWGVISGLSRAKQITWITRNAGGPSTFL